MKTGRGRTDVTCLLVENTAPGGTYPNQPGPGPVTVWASLQLTGEHTRGPRDVGQSERGVATEPFSSIQIGTGVTPVGVKETEAGDHDGTHCINRPSQKNYLIISRDAEETV